MKTQLFLPFLLIVTIAVGCKKEEEETQTQSATDKPITEAELTTWNTAARNWFAVAATAKYYSASGTLDSMYTFVPSDQSVQFSVNSTGPVPRGYGFYSYGGVMSRFWPSVGQWSLSGDGRTLTISQTSYFPDPGKPGGAYAVSYNPSTFLPFPYAKSLTLERTETLAGSRKAEISFLLGSH